MKKILHKYSQSMGSVYTVLSTVLCAVLAVAFLLGCDGLLSAPSDSDLSVMVPDMNNADGADGSGDSGDNGSGDAGDGGASGDGDELPPPPPDTVVEPPVAPPVVPPAPPAMPPIEPPVAPPAPVMPPITPPAPPANALPRILSTEFTVFENIADTETIGTVQARDSDEGDNLSYAISAATSDNAGSGGLFEIDPSTGALSLVSGQNLDYETQATHSITVQVSDGTASTEASISINVQNITEVLNARISGLETGTEASVITLSADSSYSDGTITSYLWEQIDPASSRLAALIDSPSAATASITLPYTENASETLRFRLTVGAADLSDSIEHNLTVTRGNIDSDGDGLIEIRGLTMLHDMRYNLAGTSYKTSESDSGDTSGCPADACSGYELVYDLNFDKDGDGSTWSGTAGRPGTAGNYSLDADDSQAPYFVIDEQGNGGWNPIGDSAESSAFQAQFNGNGYSIRNLAILRESESFVGLFGHIVGSRVYNVSILNALVTGNESAGILAGQSARGMVAATSVTGIVQAIQDTGGLIGLANSTTIFASFSGAQVVGRIYTGGLVGLLITGSNASVYSSYAGGSVISQNNVGSFIGYRVNSNIFGSYATGNVQGDVDVGNLLGTSYGGQITESYGFGTATGRIGGNAPNGSSLPSGVSSPADLSATNAGDSWNEATRFSLGAWDFSRRTASGGPSLRSADYDGASGNAFYCEGEAAPSVGSGAPRPIAVANCGEHLPGQF